MLFLDKRNQLIADEVQQTGTVDHTPVYPREVVKRALELKATAIILVHNHPSGDPTPSRADIQMTQAIVDVASRSASPCTITSSSARKDTSASRAAADLIVTPRSLVDGRFPRISADRPTARKGAASRLVVCAHRALIEASSRNLLPHDHDSVGSTTDLEFPNRLLSVEGPFCVENIFSVFRFPAGPRSQNRGFFLHMPHATDLWCACRAVPGFKSFDKYELAFEEVPRLTVEMSRATWLCRSSSRRSRSKLASRICSKARATHPCRRMTRFTRRIEFAQGFQAACFYTA